MSAKQAHCLRCGTAILPQPRASECYCQTCLERNLFDTLGLPTPPRLLDRWTERPTLTLSEYLREIEK